MQGHLNILQNRFCKYFVSHFAEVEYSEQYNTLLIKQDTSDELLS